jgi:hypothetical protein
MKDHSEFSDQVAYVENAFLKEIQEMRKRLTKKLFMGSLDKIQDLFLYCNSEMKGLTGRDGEEISKNLQKNQSGKPSKAVVFLKRYHKFLDQNTK